MLKRVPGHDNVCGGVHPVHDKKSDVWNLQEDKHKRFLKLLIYLPDTLNINAIIGGGGKRCGRRDYCDNGKPDGTCAGYLPTEATT